MKPLKFSFSLTEVINADSERMLQLKSSLKKVKGFSLLQNETEQSQRLADGRWVNC